MEVHDDNAVFQCEACPKTFGTSYNMKKHFSRMHKNKKVLKRVLCSSGCGKLIVKERMAQHIRAVHLDHFSHKCEVCGMQFKVRCFELTFVEYAAFICHTFFVPFYRIEETGRNIPTSIPTRSLITVAAGQASYVKVS